MRPSKQMIVGGGAIAWILGGCADGSIPGETTDASAQLGELEGATDAGNGTAGDVDPNPEPRDCEGDRDLASPEQLAAFALENCRRLGGHLIIRHMTAETIEGLSALRTIRGGLYVHSNPSLTSLRALESLESIGGDFEIRRNAQLQSVSELTHLATIGGHLVIEANPMLPAVRGFPALEVIGKSWTVALNHGLKSIGGFEVLTIIGDSWTVIDNPMLESIEGLPALEDIGIRTRLGSEGGREPLRRITLVDNPRLRALGRFSKLAHVYGTILVQNNAQLHGIGAYPALERLDGDLIVESNAVHSLDGFAALKHIGSINISEEPFLTTLRGFGSLETISGTVFIMHVPVVAIEAMSRVRHIGRDLHLQALRELRQLSGFESLESVGNSVALFELPKLTHVDELRKLRSIGGDLGIVGTPELRDLTGMGALERVEGSVHLNDCAPSLMGLENLARVKHLIIGAKDRLMNLQGLGGLTQVDGTVMIGAPFSPEFRLDGLNALTDVSGGLEITVGTPEITGLRHVEVIGEGLSIHSSPRLSSLGPLLDWPEDVVRGGLEILSNPRLPACEVAEFDRRQTNSAATCRDACVDNDEEAECAP